MRWMKQKNETDFANGCRFRPRDDGGDFYPLSNDTKDRSGRLKCVDVLMNFAVIRRARDAVLRAQRARLIEDHRIERKLAAVLAADVAGYSRLMSRDEEGTYRRLKAHLCELVEPRIAAHRGRIVKRTGDGLLVDFASVVEAVRCALAIQSGMAERNRAVPADQHVAFRMGISLGDVIIDGNDIYGDEVNIAARLERIAEPGAVYVSSAVRDVVRGRPAIVLQDLGEWRLKNIAKSVRVFRIDAPGLPVGAAPASVPDKPLIAVLLPFADMSGEAGLEYISGGITRS